MTPMKNYNIENSINPKKIKDFRKKLGMTQAEFAKFLGISRPTVERMESSHKDITGPIAVLIDLLQDNTDLIEEQRIPDKIYPLRLWYMYKDKKCTLIDVDELNKKVYIRNYVTNIMYRAFGNNDKPSFSDYEEFLKSRCFPESRDKIKIELESLGLPFYDTMMIIQKTEGRMAEDNFWILIEKNN